MMSIICLMGATATGKTTLAIELVRRFPCEIISVDSAMVYRGMDIGTAKPKPEELEKAPHRLIDICDPAEPYSAGRFRDDALQAIEEIFSCRKIPLLVGGSMLYFHVLQHGVAALPSADNTVRDALTTEANQIGWPLMHQQLAAIDPESAQQIHPHDAQRIQRALEVYRITGQTISELQSLQAAEKLAYPVLNITMLPKDRALLHQRIEQRFHSMISDGLIDEVKSLRQRSDLHAQLPSIRTVGYRQVWKYLEGEYDYSNMVDRAIIATRQLAKRQLTWLRGWGNTRDFYFEDKDHHDQIFSYLKSELSL